MNIIGRYREKDLLRRCCNSHSSELVCVYGRRRVGKTYLVEQFFANEFAFRATGIHGAPQREQLKAFGIQLYKYGDPSAFAPKNWYDAFRRLEILLNHNDVCRSEQGKRVVFLDEFPWFASQRSSFLSAFAQFWNTYSNSNPDLVVIICGSATSWIVDNVLEDTGNLFYRVTCPIFLKPFSLAETEEFFKKRDIEWNRYKIAECQMVFGGLPFFFERLDPNLSFAQNIDNLCLDSHGLFHAEITTLLETTLRKSPIYADILMALASHRNGMQQGELERLVGAAPSVFLKAIKNLCKCGYISRRRLPHKKGNAYFLQLIDPFILFHYKFIAPSGDTANATLRKWHHFTSSGGAYANWRGHAFEILCQYHLEEVKRCIGIADIKVEAYPWESERKHGGAQLDLVLERADGQVNICEVNTPTTCAAIASLKWGLSSESHSVRLLE